MKLWSTKKADNVFSKWIRERDPRCFFCSNPSTQNSHFWPRENSATRYDPLNCDGICGGCHMRHESKKHDLYETKKRAQLGNDGYEALRQRAYSVVKRSDSIKHLMSWITSEK